MSHLILFVCTGNVCRSPMAAALFNGRARRAGEDHLYLARSAGTWGLDGEPASPHAATVMRERGLSLADHRAHTISLAEMEQSAVVVVMTRSHRDALAAEFASQRAKLHLMSELRGQTFDVADPYGGTLAEYRACAASLQDMIERGYGQIKAWISDRPDSSAC